MDLSGPFRGLMSSYIKALGTLRQRAFIAGSGASPDHRINNAYQEEERMRKLLLATAAVAGLALASPAFAARDHNGPAPNPEDTGGGQGGQGRWNGGADNPSNGGADGGLRCKPA